MRKLLLLPVMLVLIAGVASALCTLTLDSETYKAGDTAVAEMICDGAKETKEDYTVTWRDDTAGEIVETDTGKTPDLTGTYFYDSYSIPINWTDGNVLRATLSGKDLEGSDSAIVETSYSINTTIDYPQNRFSIIENDTFILDCNVTNDGLGNLSNVNLYAVYDNGSVIRNDTATGYLTLNETGNYSCGTLVEGGNCSYSWNVTANVKSDETRVACYAQSDQTSDYSDSVKVDVFESENDLSINLDSRYYSPGETSTATMTSYFTSADYNVVWRNSTGGVLCNETGITPSISNDEFLESCLIPSSQSFQDNNTAEFYINGDDSISVNDSYNISNVSARSYSIVNTQVRYDDAFLGEGQSVRAEIYDSNGELAIGESCKISVYDLESEVPIYDTGVKTIGGEGVCIAEFNLNNDIFESRDSYQVIIEAWQSSDEDLPASDRKRGYGTTSFNIIPYIIDDEITVPEDDLTAGFDSVTEVHTFTNNFDEILHTTENVWFSNVDTEQDYHFEELEDLTGSFNQGSVTTINSYEVPEEMPSGTYRLEHRIRVYYNERLREEYTVKSNNFTITSVEDSIDLENVRIRDGFNTEINTRNNLLDNYTLPDSNYTSPYYVFGEGYEYQVCGDFYNHHDDEIFIYLNHVSLNNPSIGNTFDEFTRNGEQWVKTLSPGLNRICYNDNIPDGITTHSDWRFSMSAFLGEGSGPFYCAGCTLGFNSDYFYIGAIDEVVNFNKWIVEPNSTHYGKPQIFIVTERNNIMSMNDDCEYKSQSEIPWGESNVTCYEKDTGEPQKTDYSDYPIAGEDFKVCMQVQNYLSDEVKFTLDNIFLNNDEGENVVHYNGVETIGYVPSITHDSLYLQATPSREYELNGELTDGYGIFCTRWLEIPNDIVGGNNWDFQATVNPSSSRCDYDDTFFVESDEFAIYGRDYNSSTTEFFTINDFSFTHDNATEGEFFQFQANVTNNLPYDEEVVFKGFAQANSNGTLDEIQLYDYKTGDHIGNKITTPFNIAAGETATFNSRRMKIPHGFRERFEGNKLEAGFVLQLIDENNHVTWTQPYEGMASMEVISKAIEIENIEYYQSNATSCSDYKLNMTYNNPTSATSTEVYNKIEAEEYYVIKVCIEDVVNDINLNCNYREFQPDTGFNLTTILEGYIPYTPSDTTAEFEVSIHEFEQEHENEIQRSGDETVDELTGDTGDAEFELFASEDPACKFIASDYDTESNEMYLQWLQAQGLITGSEGTMFNNESFENTVSYNKLIDNEIADGDDIKFEINISKNPDNDGYYKIYYDFFKNNNSEELHESLSASLSGRGLKTVSFDEYHLSPNGSFEDYKVYSRISRLNEYGVWESFETQDVGTVTVYENTVPQETEGTVLSPGEEYSYLSNGYNVTFTFANQVTFDNISISGSGLLLDNSHNLSLIPSSDNVTVKVYNWDGYDHYFGIYSPTTQQVGVNITVNGTEQYVDYDGEYTKDYITVTSDEETWEYVQSIPSKAGGGTSSITGYSFSTIRDSEEEPVEREPVEISTKHLLIGAGVVILILLVILLARRSGRKTYENRNGR